MAKVTRLSFDHAGGLERRRLHLREISADADAPLETVGQDLRAARQRKGEDLATVSKALKIRKDHLEGLEESDFDVLPGRTYALGFMRSYAEYLGLDAAQCVERYKAEIAGHGEPDDFPFPAAPEPERKLPQGSIILGIIMLIAVAYGGYYLSVSAERMLAEPAVAAVAPELAEAPATIPAPAEAAAVPAANSGAEAAEPAAAAETAQPIALASAVNLPPGQAYGTQNTGSRLTLRFHETVRVLVQGADETVYLNRTLRPGDRYQAPNVIGMTITTPDSGAVELILDGVSLGFAGARGALAEGLSLDPQNVVDRARQNTG